MWGKVPSGLKCSLGPFPLGLFLRSAQGPDVSLSLLCLTMAYGEVLGWEEVVSSWLAPYRCSCWFPTQARHCLDIRAALQAGSSAYLAAKDTGGPDGGTCLISAPPLWPLILSGPSPSPKLGTQSPLVSTPVSQFFLDCGISRIGFQRGARRWACWFSTLCRTRSRYQKFIDL